MKRLVVLVAATALLAISHALGAVRRHRLLGDGRAELAAQARPPRPGSRGSSPCACSSTDGRPRRRGAGDQDQEGCGQE